MYLYMCEPISFELSIIPDTTELLYLVSALINGLDLYSRPSGLQQKKTK